MAHSGRERHRDRDPFRRQPEAEPPSPDRVFRMREGQRQDIATYLRHIDEARQALEAQMRPENRQIIRDLRAAADGIFDVLNELEVVDG